jgi:hypothetical protein
VALGPTATIGNTYEPTLGFTHNLDVLGVCLASGWAWGDAVWCAMPVLSWQGVAIGDPLYVPMKVDVPAQLRGIGDADNIFLGQYAVIRALRTMVIQGKADAALDMGSRAFMEIPGLALALELARMENDAGRPEAAVKRLRFMGHITTFSTDDRGVALDAARFLQELGAQRLALELLTALRGDSEMSAAMRAQVAAEGLRAATALGDIAEIAKWQPEPTEPAKAALDAGGNTP